ncbi:MAG: zinc metalloprotease HtpX [Campylobacteraceae bacterium]|jgi:heat shock protein HtpX|nr:zinc metalloprotease HtpX [Campylobacteraceae bacterium]
MEIFKTVFFMTALMLLLIFIGGYVGGGGGMLIAFAIGAAVNFFSYFFSDKLVLRHYRAVEVNRQNAKGFYEIVERLAKKADIPMPKVYIIPEAVPNAFATGRNRSNAAVCATEGLLNLLSEEEIEGVMAHELSHVRHYDILIGSMAATIAGAIAIAANILQYGALLGRNRQNPIVMIAIAIVLPIAAAIIQMSISRSREYMADEGAARLTAHPEWLQSALLKLDAYARGGTMRQASQESAHMFIVNPFSGKNISFASLFSTHPSIENRIARLEKLKNAL